MRKQKATVASIAAIRSSEKKVATREIKRLGNLTAEQMRLSGEKMQPHEMSMLDFKYELLCGMNAVKGVISGTTATTMVAAVAPSDCGGRVDRTRCTTLCWDCALRENDVCRSLDSFGYDS
jgi:hypothetical protein